MKRAAKFIGDIIGYLFLFLAILVSVKGDWGMVRVCLFIIYLEAFLLVFLAIAVLVFGYTPTKKYRVIPFECDCLVRIAACCFCAFYELYGLGAGMLLCVASYAILFSAEQAT